MRNNDEARKREERRNYIEQKAREVINGRYGNGEARRRALGNDFRDVQNRVNEILGFSKRY